ncbi:MAG: SRPBCC family protein [Pyrinomonadaceae bacterium]
MIEHAAELIPVVETAQAAVQKLGLYQKMKRHPLMTGGIVLAGAGLAYAAVQLAKDPGTEKEGKAGTGASAVHLETSIAINRSPEELYGIWRDFKMLPLIMSNLESVTDLGGGKSHWVAKGLAGTKVKWDAETIQDKPNELIAWQSLDGSEVPNAGSVRFQPGPKGRGTYVRVTLNYAPPAGQVGAIIAELFGFDPAQLIKEDLQRFKQMMEAGEVATTEGQPSGRAADTDSADESKQATRGTPDEGTKNEAATNGTAKQDGSSTNGASKKARSAPAGGTK